MEKENNVFLGDSLKKELMQNNKDFADLVNHYKAEGLVFDFGADEWNKIKSQNFPDLPGGFMEVFEKGINIGNCGAVAKRLSYSYDIINIVIGNVPVLEGTIGSPKGGHAWLEDYVYIYDTTLLLKIHKSLKEKFGYQDNIVLTSSQLANDFLYQARKDYVNDQNIRAKREVGIAK